MLQVWQLGSTSPNFTLDGHEKGVNCVDYYHGGDKPYLISGADDRMVKIWDYQNKTCVQTLEGHAQVTKTSFLHASQPPHPNKSFSAAKFLKHIFTPMILALKFLIQFGHLIIQW